MAESTHNMDNTASVEITRRATLQILESLERAGLTEMPRGRKAAPPVSAVAAPSGASETLRRASASKPAAETHAPPATVVQPPAAVNAAVAQPPSAMNTTVSQPALLLSAGWDGAPKLPPEQRGRALDMICQQVSGCERCHELATTRTQTVFGVGNPNSRLCFMGEAPGADEDKQGEPFVGRAGQLLNKIIEACTLKREDVYILNTIKCRPPGNRNPLPAEVANCREYLNRQLDIIQPEFICCLGLVAAQALLGTDSSMGRLRKQFFDYRGSRVLCTYHPAYLLRNPAAKKDVWEDMQLLMKEMGITLPGKDKPA